jgi:hypothetical protein
VDIFEVASPSADSNPALNATEGVVPFAGNEYPLNTVPPNPVLPEP